MEKTKTLFSLVLLLCSFVADAKSIINKIVYKGNEVTREIVLNREIYISSGDKFDEALIEKSRQAIMDLGLFKSVTYYLEENYQKGNAKNKNNLINVIFVIKEKYFILLIPRLKIEEDKVYYGLQFKGDNLWGLNHSMRLLAEDRGVTKGVDESRYSFKYFYPNINNSHYNLDFLVQTINTVDETDGLVDRQDDNYRTGLTRWLNKKGQSRGWFIGGNVAYQQRFNENLIIQDNSQSINATILGMDIGYKNTNDFKYNRGGKSYGYNLNWSGESINSEAAFTKHLFYYQSYYRLKNDPVSNVNVQMKLGYANDKILDEYAFRLGSSSDLRGYENNRFQGNTLFLSNIEYMFPKFNKPLIRYVTFIDIGNTYQQLSDVLHRPLNIGAGVGLRWKIRSLVKIDLRADVAYGVSDEDYRFSFGTRHAF